MRSRAYFGVKETVKVDSNSRKTSYLEINVEQFRPATISFRSFYVKFDMLRFVLFGYWIFHLPFLS